MGAAVAPLAAILFVGGECLALSPSHSRFAHMLPESAEYQWSVAAANTSEASSKPVRLEDIADWQFREASVAWEVHSNLLGAIRLFGQSAQKGFHIGEYCYRWGLYHELPPADVEQARRWYSRGARTHHQGCTTMLGKMHLVKGEKVKAAEVFLKTAAPHSFGGKTGDSLAQWFLAELSFESGKLRQAVRWWKRSAENGDIDAMMRLFEVFSTGAMGIPQEDMRGRHWLFAAAAHGHQAALSKVSWPANLTDRPKVERQWIGQMQERGWV